MVSHDWEADGRPFPECLNAWTKRRGTRAQAATRLRVPFSTFCGWLVGRPCKREATIRLAMTLIDSTEGRT